MKNIRLAFAAIAAALAFVSCGKDSPEGGQDDVWTGEGSVEGTWHLTGWNSLQSADVYMSFSEDGSFDIWQRLYTPYYEHFDGTWQQSGSTLNGSYSDGMSWAGTYSVSFNTDGTGMRLILDGNSADASIFTRSDIPDDILSGLLGTKSGTGISSGKRFL